ncbi:ribose-5-phosphate isomerase RpiA [soil metagenome]|nr:ribose-5-phosphate isomerase RpiA [Gemmatimonadota bacterium]
MSETVGTEKEEARKRVAAEHAAQWIEDGMVIGLGTGSTVRHLLDYIAERRAEGEWKRIVGIPSSRETELRARSLNIPLGSLDKYPSPDLMIDGADEVDNDLRLIKGLGGALLREKIVAEASKLLVIVVDDTKLVDRLGSRVPLPVEVDCFGAATHLPFFRSIGAEPELRRGGDGEPFLSDGGHLIYDCHFRGGISEPEALERTLLDRPGILETGLFLGMADDVVAAGGAGTRVITRYHSRESDR